MLSRCMMLSGVMWGLKSSALRKDILLGNSLLKISHTHTQSTVTQLGKDLWLISSIYWLINRETGVSRDKSGIEEMRHTAYSVKTAFLPCLSLSFPVSCSHYWFYPLFSSMTSVSSVNWIGYLWNSKWWGQNSLSEPFAGGAWRPLYQGRAEGGIGRVTEISLTSFCIDNWRGFTTRQQNRSITENDS